MKLALTTLVSMVALASVSAQADCWKVPDGASAPKTLPSLICLETVKLYERGNGILGELELNGFGVSYPVEINDYSNHASIILTTGKVGGGDYCEPRTDWSLVGLLGPTTRVSPTLVTAEVIQVAIDQHHFSNSCRALATSQSAIELKRVSEK